MRNQSIFRPPLLPRLAIADWQRNGRISRLVHGMWTRVSLFVRSDDLDTRASLGQTSSPDRVHAISPASARQTRSCLSAILPLPSDLLPLRERSRAEALSRLPPRVSVLTLRLSGRSRCRWNLRL